jgi:integrase
MRGSLRSRQRGVWELRVYVATDDDGREVRRSRTFRGARRAAEVALAEFVAEVAASRGPRATRGTVADMAGQWVDHVRPDRAVTTMASWDGHARAIAASPLGSMRLDQVTSRDIDRHLKAYGEDHAPSTVRQRRVVLSGLFGLARQWGLSTRDPMAQAARVTGRRARVEAVPPEVVERLMAAAEPNATMSMLLRLAISTGARRGELCALQWVDLAERRLTIQRAAVQAAGSGVQVKGTKTHAVRVVTLDEGTVAAWAEHRAEMERRAKACGVRLGPWVLSTDPACRTPLTPGTVSQWWGRLVAREGLAGMKLHGLRHLSASWLLAQGVPLPVVSARLGHASTATTLAIYAHALPGGDEAAGAVAGGLFS